MGGWEKFQELEKKKKKKKPGGGGEKIKLQKQIGDQG